MPVEIETRATGCEEPASVGIRLLGVGFAIAQANILSGIDLEIGASPVTVLLGPNGSGKTTLFNVITGLYTPTAGKIEFNGKDITKDKPYNISAFGLARTFQNINLFESKSSLENVKMGQHCTTKSGILDALVHTRRYRQEELDITRKAAELVEFVGLEHSSDELVKNLPYGEQKRLEIARSLASDPKMLLLDEPTAGLNPKEKAEVADLIKTVHEKGITIVLIEHDMRVVMGISKRIIVLDHGERIASGVPDEIKKDKRVIEAYLGKQAAGNC